MLSTEACEPDKNVQTQCHIIMDEFYFVTLYNWYIVIFTNQLVARVGTFQLDIAQNIDNVMLPHKYH